MWSPVGLLPLLVWIEADKCDDLQASRFGNPPAVSFPGFISLTGYSEDLSDLKCRHLPIAPCFVEVIAKGSRILRRLVATLESRDDDGLKMG